jgi:hypothetical protein
MHTASVSNLDLFRVWREDEDLDLGWILNQILHPPEQTEHQKAGEALHKALELASLGDHEDLTANGYHFACLKDCEIELAPLRELQVSKYYGNLRVRGRVDATTGPLVTDYKSVQQFDADRLISSFQWRLYLDMTGADRFRWNVFVLSETDDPKLYIVSEFHRLEQRRYPELAADCASLARDYLQFAQQHLPSKQLREMVTQ